MIKHNPRQVNPPVESKLVRHVSPNAAANRRGTRKFTLDEIRATGPDQDVTLPHLTKKCSSAEVLAGCPTQPRPHKLKAKDLVDQLNSLEATFNRQGGSLREKPNGPLVETKQDRAALQRKAAEALASHAPGKAAPKIKKQGKGSVQASDLNPANSNSKLAAVKQDQATQTQSVQQTQKAIAAPPPSNPQPNVLPAIHESWRADLGDRDILAGALVASLDMTGDSNKLTAVVEGKAIATLLAHDFDLLVAHGDLSSGNASAPGTANLYAQVVGLDLFRTSALSKDGQEDIGVDESVDFHFAIGPIPMVARFGARGSAGIHYSYSVSPLFAEAVAVPFLDTSAYGECGIDLEVAEAGFGGSLTLIQENLEIGAKVWLDVNSAGNPEFRWNYHADNTLNALSGKLYAYAMVDYFVDTWRGEWTIFDWDGLTMQATLFEGGGSQCLYGQNCLVKEQIQLASYDQSGGSGGKKKIACPAGQFGTKGNFHDCECPNGTTKQYQDPLKVNAMCKGPGLSNPCPGGALFDTRSNHKDCACPSGTSKHYADPPKVNAWCAADLGNGKYLCPPGSFLNYGNSCSCASGMKKDCGPWDKGKDCSCKRK